MAENKVVIEVACSGVDAAQAKVDELTKKIAEAKTLANELASALEGLRIEFSRE